MRLRLVALLLLSACADLGSPNPSLVANIEGCQEAVRHLHECCPGYSLYVSCSVLKGAANVSAQPDLSERQSRCLQAKSCQQIEAAVGKNGSLCDFRLTSSSCR